MAHLFDRHWTRAELLSRVGDLSQLAGIRLAEWSEGAERGVRVATLDTGSGFQCTVLLDRGMDLGPASFRGRPLAWLSPAGFSHPAHYEPEGLGWLRTFGGGLMTGCGLTHLGDPDEDEGESMGLHGRLSLLPARQVQVGEEWQGDECCFWVQGQMRQARLYGEHLRLTRRVSCWLGQSRISVHDQVENMAPTPSPLMILYHINLGFPLLDSSCELVAQSHPVRPKDSIAASGIGEWMRFQPPTPGYGQQVFYHDLPAGGDGWAAITLRNPTLRLSLTIRFQKATLPNLVQWKMMGEGAYVLGLEPANCWVEGRSKEREQGTLQFLQPGEQRDFRVEIAVDDV